MLLCPIWQLLNISEQVVSVGKVNLAGKHRVAGKVVDRGWHRVD